MGGRLQVISLTRTRCSAYGLRKTLLAIALLALCPAVAGAQPAAPGAGREGRAFTREAGDPETLGRFSELDALRLRRRSGPSMDHSVAPAMRYQLRIAYDTAMRALRTEPDCRGLFQTIGADGEAVLARSSYSCAPASPHCQEGVAAFTTVGSAQIRLCQGFQTLRPQPAAVLLLHEALHSSGLLERPPHANALTAKEISAIVSQGCRL